MFANISHIDEVRPYVDASDGQFYITDKGDYLVANYAAIMTTFPPMDEEGGAILRECRGMLFDGKTGKIIRRPLHKFFNLGEREETRGDNFNPDDVVGVYDKLDGSMIAPFFLNNADGYHQVRWGTKAGLTHMTPDVEAFVARNEGYSSFAIMMLAVDVQPIFEYMAPKHRIVVNHDKEKMELLALRHIYTGMYYDYDTMVKCAENHGIPVVKRWDIDPKYDSLVDQVRELEGSEGVVLEMRNGDRIKVKSLWYVDLHKNREAIAREKYVVGLILNERIDDAIGLVPDFVVPRLEAYTKAFLEQYKDVSQRLCSDLYEAYCKHQTRKDFALDNTVHPLAKQIGFKMMDNPPKYFQGAWDIAFKERILAFTEKSDTDFDKLCREAVFENKLPAWNIWEETTIEE